MPVWLTYVFGLGLDGTAGRARRPWPNLLLFGLGFTLVFVGLGASLGALSQWLWTATPWLNRAGGTVLILLGLASLDLLPLPALQRGWRLAMPQRRGAEGLTSLLVGVSFAAGWTPCVGPILGAILVLAGSTGQRRGASCSCSSTPPACWCPSPGQPC